MDRTADLAVTGRVTDGLGKGAAFVSLTGYAEQFREKLDYEPYPGTLNVSIETPLGERLDSLSPIRVEKWEDGDRTFGVVHCYPAAIEAGNRLEDSKLHLIVPKRTEHDSSTIELISPANLRETVGLSDGSPVQVYVGSG